MKNTILFLTAFFLLIFSTTTIGQNIFSSFENTTLKHPGNQEISISFFSEELSSKGDGFYDDFIELRIDIVVEIVFISEMVPTTGDRLSFASASFDDLILSANNGLFNLNSRDYNTLGASLNRPVVFSDQPIYWMEMNKKGWNSNHKLQSAAPVLSLGKWNFRMGPGHDSYYFIPKYQWINQVLSI